MRVPVGLLYALVPVLTTAGIAFTAWVVRQLSHHAELLATTATEQTASHTLVATEFRSHDARIQRLEAWQDGAQFGRSVHEAQTLRESD